jgi:hypothetical protein
LAPFAKLFLPVAVASLPFAKLSWPFAVAPKPFAVLPTPVAVAAAPLARLLTPVAVALMPFAVLFAPVAVASAPVALLSTPIAVAPKPLAKLAVPNAVAEAPVALASKPIAVAAGPAGTTAWHPAAPKSVPAPEKHCAKAGETPSAVIIPAATARLRSVPPVSTLLASSAGCMSTAVRGRSSRRTQAFGDGNLSVFELFHAIDGPDSCSWFTTP